MTGPPLGDPDVCVAISVAILKLSATPPATSTGA
jgi:hypothetical protein